MRAALAAALLASGAGVTSAASGLGLRVALTVGPVAANVGNGRATLGNGLVERTWDLAAFRTLRLVDRRGPDRTWGSEQRDFSLALGPLSVGSERFTATAARTLRLAHGGVRLVLTLRTVLVPTLVVERTIDVYPGVAGFRSETVLRSSVPLVLSGMTLEEVRAGTADATLHALRAGGDWREPEWTGPTIAIGDPHAGTWRSTSVASGGRPLRGPGQWLSLRSAGRTAFVVLERNDLPSSVMSYADGVARADVDHSRDVVSLGPLEGDAHVENPLPMGVTRVRTITPGEPMRLAPVFTGFGDHEADDAWQFHKYLTTRLPPYPHAVTFNSNGTDDNRISTGAKDDMDLATVKEVAVIAKRLGVETFILDDGWQARSGDWQPDSPQYPEPRYDGTPASMFQPRFPDATFAAVREAIAPMRLGLWMSPTFSNPTAQTFTAHPEWACQPIATPLVAANLAQPGDGSNEAGVVPWSTAALTHVEARIRDAIEHWHVEYFKFDFLMWLDCASSAGVRDLYEFHDAFIAMLDRLLADHPSVTLQIDETNDYRMFPYESVTRGPTWFQNGHPEVSLALHNLWNLSPFVPAFAIGQDALADGRFDRTSVDTIMAASLLSHMTFFSDVRELPGSVIDRVAVWTAFARAHRPLLDGVVYPLLDDPFGGGWTALQSWDPEAGAGALLAFRQNGPDATQRIALVNVADGTYELTRAPDGVPVGTATAEQLRSGIDVTIADAGGASVVLIRRVPS